MKNLFTLLIATLLIVPPSWSQSITGLIDDTTGKKMDYVNVLLLSAQDSSLYKGALTDEEGKYEFKSVSKGKYIIQANSLGYTDAYSDIIDVSTMDRTIPTLTLTQGVDLSEVTVSAQKPFLELKADKMVVNVSNSAVNAGSSALEVLQKSPGVTVDNESRISLRGKQGVLVTINGKNQYLSGEEITQLLENMPSSNIDRVEIVSNPSAKYDAEGNSGIINIVLKKNEKLGSNGSISSSFRQGKHTSHFHELNLNYRSDKLNVYGGVEFNNWGWGQDIFLLRKIPFQNEITSFDQETNMTQNGTGLGFKLGADYSLSKNTDLSILAKYRPSEEDGSAGTITNISGANKPTFDILNVVANNTEDTDQQTYNANITHRFNAKGLQLSLDSDIGKYSNEDMYHYNNFYKNKQDEEVAQPFYLRNQQKTEIDIFATKLDLSIPLHEKFNLEVGSKYSKVDTRNTTLFEFKENENWINQTNRSNDFMYSEEVYAGYLNFNTSLGQYMIQGGLRLEHTDSEGHSLTLDTKVPREYTDLFPSVSISRMIGQHNISATYSRRLERPNYRALNPFEQYLDEYTFEKGNPFLNPQYSQSFGLNYMMGRALFVAINYSKTTDAITEVIEQISDENKTFQTEQNLDSYENYSITLSAPKVWSDWWTSRANLTGFLNDFQSNIPSGELNNQKFSYVASLNNEIKLPSAWNMELNGQYQSKITFGLFEIDPQFSLDLGLSKKVLNNRGKIKIGVSDILYTSNSPVRIMQDDIDLRVNQDRDSRRVRITFTYNFGNQKVKGAKRRKTATSEEQGRI